MEPTRQAIRKSCPCGARLILSPLDSTLDLLSRGLAKGERVKRLLTLSLVGLMTALAFHGAEGQAPLPSPRFDTADPACQSGRLVSTGGRFPKDRYTLAIRWTGYGNFELAYNGQVILLDAYFDRGSEYPPLGFNAADVRRADVILIGHGHYDHMSDAASVGIRTGATIVGAPATVARLQTQSIDAKQLRSVTGRDGEILQFRGFTVAPVLARHGEPPADVTTAFGKALQATVTAPTTEQSAEQALIIARGSSDPRIVAEGTIAYLITLDSGFRILYRDSGGQVTDYEKAAALRVGPVDLAIVATAASYVTALIVDQALEYVHTYRPSAFMPAHHDAAYNNLWRPTEPIFQAIKDENPKIVTISKGYREPTCFSTKKSARGNR
jgi:L-ascorbate metabolism protein UlaG (beta-lactamase superfamily)